MIIVAALISFSEASGVVYYVSNSGNDNNNGLSPLYPWKSLRKVSAEMKLFKPGDAILFEKGSYFAGQMNISCSGRRDEPVIFGAYGEGADPVIGGSLPVKNWTLHSNGIWKASYDTTAANLFENGRQLILARYPNSGFLRVNGQLQNPKTGFRDSKLRQSNGYWDGANARIRTIDWSYEHSKISVFKSGIIQLVQKTNYDIQSGWGYYLDNKLAELDTINEWYFENAGRGAGTVYFKPSEGSNPNNSFIEASQFSIGFYSGANLTDIVIRDLKFKNQIHSGIYLSGKSRRVSIVNCSFIGQLMYGVYLPSASADITIYNCNFSGINGESLYLLNSRSSVVSRNVFRNSGMIPGYGTNSAFGMSPIVIQNSDSLKISENYIFTAGHDGINCIGSGNIIEKNVVIDVLLELNDGGGIKTYGVSSFGSVWSNNFVSEVSGNIESSSSVSRIMAYGLYPDAGTHKTRLTDNTVSECSGAGIFLYENCNNNTLKSNTLLNNRISIKFRTDNETSSGNKISNNLSIGSTRDMSAVRLISMNQGFYPGSFENNTYVFPENPGPFQYEASLRLRTYSAGEWNRLLPGIEKGAVVYGTSEFSYPVLYRNMTSDTVRYLIDADSEQRDINGVKIFPSVIVLPWSSVVLFSQKDESDSPSLNLIGSPGNFAPIAENTVSTYKWFGISAKNLSAPITIKVPEGFLVSHSPDRNFSKEISIPQAGRKLNTVVFVKFSPAEKKGYYGFAEIACGNIKRQVRLGGTVR